MADQAYDFVIVGSGFGGSVSALRLAEKGYSVLVLEKGKRLGDGDFAKSNWQFWKYLWAPALKAHGVLQISTLKGVQVLHGAGVGGGSLGYAGVLEVPTEATFATPAWNAPLPWGEVLAPHYETARRMLGVARNPTLSAADRVLEEMAKARGLGDTFRTTEVGVFFGEKGVTVPDPFFDGEGPERAGCRECGGCMVGCRYNAKNTLPKNYLWLAERRGVEVRPEVEVVDVRPLGEVEPASDGPAGDGPPRYELTFRRSTRRLFRRKHTVRARNVIFSAGVMGTLRLLLNLRDVKRSLTDLSPRLGDRVRTNSEALLGSSAWKSGVDYSKGVAITSIFNADPITRVEPVRYPDGSSLMRFLSAPLIDLDAGPARRLWDSLRWLLRHPVAFARSLFAPGWARNTTVLLVMQHVDNRMRFRVGRSLYTLGRRDLVAEQTPGYEVSPNVPGSHALAREFAERTGGVAVGSVGENLLDLPTTAHILGGAPIGASAAEGVVDARFQVHHYPGLYVVDGSVMPANPGVNPSLTITALAEYAMAQMPAKGEARGAAGA